MAKLTENNKKYIDSRTYGQLLLHWRFAPIGDKWFEGETGEYWGKRMAELRNLPRGNEEHIRKSKALGW